MRQNIFVVVFLAFAGLVSGQVNKSNLTGIVRDGTGAAIPGVTIKLASIGTGAVRTETSDTSGFYRFTLIDRGVYRLEAEHAGFKQFRQDSVELQTGETTTIDIALTLGEDGSLLVTADQTFRAEPMTIEPVSTVGAGDSFVGGLVAALASGKSLEQAFRIAVAAAAPPVM